MGLREECERAMKMESGVNDVRTTGISFNIDRLFHLTIAGQREFASANAFVRVSHQGRRRFCSHLALYPRDRDPPFCRRLGSHMP